VIFLVISSDFVFRLSFYGFLVCLVLLPNDPILLVGQTLEMFCTVECGGRYKAKDLTFVMYDPDRKYEANSSYVDIINSTTARFSYPNMKYSRATVNCETRNGKFGSGQLYKVGCEQTLFYFFIRIYFHSEEL